MGVARPAIVNGRCLYLVAVVSFGVGGERDLKNT